MLAFDMQKKQTLMAEANNMIIPSSDTMSYGTPVMEEMTHHTIKAE